jgi:hypothetical protein
MKNLWIISFLLFPGVLFAQKVITLSVNQPPEFGFSVGKTDTTIVRGAAVELGTDMTVFGGSGEYLYHWGPTETLSDSTILHPVATPADTTEYILTVTDQNGCSFSVGYTVNVREKTVNVPFESQSQTLQAVLFPNPSDGTFKVKITGKAVPKIELLLYFEKGELLKQQTLSHFTGEHMETFRLERVSGVYTLQIVAGDERISRQFIIQ